MPAALVAGGWRVVAKLETLPQQRQGLRPALLGGPAGFDATAEGAPGPAGAGPVTTAGRILAVDQAHPQRIVSARPAVRRRAALIQTLLEDGTHSVAARVGAGPEIITGLEAIFEDLHAAGSTVLGQAAGRETLVHDHGGPLQAAFHTPRRPIVALAETLGEETQRQIPAIYVRSARFPALGEDDAGAPSAALVAGRRRIVTFAETVVEKVESLGAAVLGAAPRRLALGEVRIGPGPAILAAGRLRLVALGQTVAQEVFHRLRALLLRAAILPAVGEDVLGARGTEAVAGRVRAVAGRQAFPEAGLRRLVALLFAAAAGTAVLKGLMRGGRAGLFADLRGIRLAGRLSRHGRVGEAGEQDGGERRDEKTSGVSHDSSLRLVDGSIDESLYDTAAFRSVKSFLRSPRSEPGGCCQSLAVSVCVCGRL